jgi:potassium-transporting ATPase potassium-binding subunit
MFADHSLVVIPVLHIAGTLAAKPTVPASNGTLPTQGMQFVGLLVGTPPPFSPGARVATRG